MRSQSGRISFCESGESLLTYLHGFVAKIANGILALISLVRHDGIGGLQGTKDLFNSVPASFCITNF